MDDSSLINDLVDTLLAEQKLAVNTKGAYRRDIKAFLGFVADYNGQPITIDMLRRITEHDLRAWLTHRIMHNKAAKRSNNRAISALRLFCKAIQKKHSINNDFTATARYTKTPKLAPKPADIDAIKTITDNQVKNWIDLRDKAMIMLLYGCGLRISEALALCEKQIDGKTTFIRVIGKGNKERTVPVLKCITEVILAYKVACAPHRDQNIQNQPLFIGARGRALSRSHFTRKLLRMSGGKIYSHKLRHSCASHLLDGGGSIKLVQQLLGHQSLGSTQIYTEASKRNIINQYATYHRGRPT